jgi:hypothetical protein
VRCIRLLHNLKGEPSIKKLVPVLILAALALSFSVAGAEPPGPNAGWLRLECESGLRGDVWFGSQHSQAFHMPEGPILHPRAGWLCFTEELCGDEGWVPWFSMPGEANGVDTIACYAHPNAPQVKHLKIEVAVAPPE